MHKYIVTNKPELFPIETAGIQVISPKAYLSDPIYSKQKNVRVFNLCSDYKYQSKGYYVSLLAEARGHHCIPDAKSILDLKNNGVIKSLTDDLNSLIQKNLKHLKSKEFELSVYFGQNLASQYSKLCHELQKMFPVPMFKVKFVKTQQWNIQSIKALSIKEIPEHHLSFVSETAKEFFGRKSFRKSKNEIAAYDLAILIDSNEKAAPSNARALVKFKTEAEKQDFYVEFITKEDTSKLMEFDALFIRTTTSVNHYTYKLARKAESEGIAVLDDPSSILKCANKVYLAELLKNAKILTPKTMIVHQENKHEVEKTLGLPAILKLPDSSFSLGVVKASTATELQLKLKEMFEQSELVIAQSYTPTPFDWRIGVLNNEVLYACKYYMAKDHWQIYNWEGKSIKTQEGGFETVALSDVPDFVLQTALKSCALIGNGLYGVDIKEVDQAAMIIEINDNPNIDAGVEDLIAGQEIYKKIIQWLKQKVLDRTHSK